MVQWPMQNTPVMTGSPVKPNNIGLNKERLVHSNDKEQGFQCCVD